jgi:hypothetical protein
MSYTFLDAAASVRTADSSIIAGVVQRPIVDIGSILTAIPVISEPIANQSVSGAITIAGGSVLSIPSSSSILGTYAEDVAHATGAPGLFVLRVRNDNMSSVTSADGDYSPSASGPVGETIVANAPITKWVSGTNSVMYGSSVTVLAAQGASVFTYVTSYQIVNDSANYSRVTLFGATSSVIGYTVAPANSGSNVILPNALKTNANGAVFASITGVSSVYLTVSGFTSRT